MLDYGFTLLGLHTIMLQVDGLILWRAVVGFPPNVLRLGDYPQDP